MCRNKQNNRSATGKTIKNIAKIVELVEMLPKKLGDFYKFIKENNEGGNSDG